MKSRVKGQGTRDALAARFRVTRAEMIALAKEAARRAYCPYSKFPVGVALGTKSGMVFTGCNVENASYGLTICAERVAILKAISEGKRDLDQMVIYTPTRTLTVPCGACRQVMAEFAPNLTVTLVNKAGRTRSYSVRELLPERFVL